MKKTILAFLLSPLLFSFNLMAQNWVLGGNTLPGGNRSIGSNNNFSVIFETNNTERGRLTNTGLWGIGTATPENKLHVFKGSAGSVTGYVNAPLIVENSTHNYINILAPDATETGILFGKPASNISGGIIYNNSNTLNGLQFRTHNSTTRMVLTESGNLGVGTLAPGSFRTKISHGDFGLDIENASNGNDWELYTSAQLELYFNGFFRGQFNSASGAYTGVSDERLKTNIKPMTTMLDKINQLKPSTYQFKNATDIQEYNGFIAQDVLKVFPAMVAHNVDKERNLDVYTMDYSGFGVIAVKGIQELQPIIEEQKVEILMLKDRLAKLEAALAGVIAGKALQNADAVKGAALDQSIPNPSGGPVTLRYFLPGNVKKAAIQITSINGSVIKSYPITTFGNGQLAINAKELAAGEYIYTLIINGSRFDSKKMIISR